MASLPLHPQFVHLPLALATILPLLTVVVAILIRRGTFPRAVWALVVGLQVLTTASGYIAMEMGEKDEHTVEELVGKAPMHEHEERAEMFVAFTVAATAVATAALFVKPAAQLYVMLAALLIMLGQSFFGYRAGQSGGELVYIHKAPNAFKTEPVPVAAPEPVLESAESHEDDNEYSPGEAAEDEEDDEEEKDE